MLSEVERAELLKSLKEDIRQAMTKYRHRNMRLSLLDEIRSELSDRFGGVLEELNLDVIPRWDAVNRLYVMLKRTDGCSICCSQGYYLDLRIGDWVPCPKCKGSGRE